MMLLLHGAISENRSSERTWQMHRRCAHQFMIWLATSAFISETGHAGKKPLTGHLFIVYRLVRVDVLVLVQIG